jgi:hypothetical protein
MDFATSLIQSLNSLQYGLLLFLLGRPEGLFRAE